MKIFFACTFDKKSQRAVNRILRRFQDIEDFKVEKWIARKPGESLHKRAQEEISTCEAVVAVITAGSLWPTLEAHIHSLRADAASRKLYLFIERGVRSREVYRELTPNIFYFDKGNLGDALEQVNYVIEDLLELGDKYRVLRLSKRTRVLRNGNGVVTFSWDLQVSANRTAALRILPPSRFGISEDAAARARKKLARVEKLWTSKLDPFRGPAFVCRVLSHVPSDIVITKVIDRGPRTGATLREFDLVLNRELGPKDKLSWGWGFSFPKLYNPAGPEYSSYVAKQDVEVADFEVQFELGRSAHSALSFDVSPTLVHLAKNGDEKFRKGADPSRGLCFLSFAWKGVVREIKEGDRVEITWNARKKR